MPDPLTGSQMATVVVQMVADNMPTLLGIVAVCAGIKIVLDLVWDYTMGITGSRRGR